MASLQFVIAAAVAMLLVVGLIQVVTYQYIRGATVAALERGVRSGSLVGAGTSECLAAANDSLADLLAGPGGNNVTVRCAVDGPSIVGQANGEVPAWIPGLPSLSFDVAVRATRETGS